jgi:periplasmic divalent cation tolerance protein
MTEYIIIITATNSKSNAKLIANSLVEEKLAACVQIIPEIKSTFKWRGSIAEEREILVLIKTIDTLKDDIKIKIKKNHNYETPEIISFPFNILTNDYKKWFDLSVGTDIE